MKKGIGVYLLYMAEISMIGVFVIVLLAFRLQESRKDFLKNNLYSEAVSGLQLSSHQFPEDVDFVFPRFSDEDYMLYRFFSEDTEEIIRGVYGTKDVFGFTKLMGTGHFFTEDDYTGKTKTAVVGEKIIPLLNEKDGKSYYAYNQSMYEVIGVFQKTDTVLDHTTFLNLACIQEETDRIGIYYVDAKEKKTVSKVLLNLKSQAEGRYKATDIVYESTISFELGRQNNAMLIFASLSSLFCLVITSVFFVTAQEYTVAVQKMCGMTKRIRFLLYGKRMGIVTLLSFILIVLLSLLLSRLKTVFFVADFLGFRTYAATGGFLFLLAFANTILITCIGNRVNISDTLKGM